MTVRSAPRYAVVARSHSASPFSWTGSALWTASWTRNWLSFPARVPCATARSASAGVRSVSTCATASPYPDSTTAVSTIRSRMSPLLPALANTVFAATPAAAAMSATVTRP